MFGIENRGMLEPHYHVGAVPSDPSLPLNDGLAFARGQRPLPWGKKSRFEHFGPVTTQRLKQTPAPKRIKRGCSPFVGLSLATH